MIARRRCAAAIACAVAAACSSPAPPPPGRDAGSARPAPPPEVGADAAPDGPRVIVMSEPELALPSQESFRLLDPGKGARRVLRYRPAAGATAITARTALTTRRLERGELSPPAPLPAIRDGFAITIAAEAPRRLALRALPGEAATASAETGAYLAAWRSLLQDRRIAVEVDDRGAIGAIRFDDDPAGAHGAGASAGARDELVQRLLTLIIPLPAEPVAPGARWRVVTILRQGPAVAKQTATYTLIARTAAAWKLRVQLQRVAEPQPIVDPSLPPGTSAELVALFRALDGDVEVDPGLPVIAGGSLAIESRLHARLQPAGGTALEQMFEDTGTVRLVRCRAGKPAAPPPAPAAPLPPLASLSGCPDGFSR